MANEPNPNLQERIRAIAPLAIDALVEIATTRTASKTTRLEAVNALRKHLGMFRNKKSSDLSSAEREQLLLAAREYAKRLKHDLERLRKGE